MADTESEGSNRIIPPEIITDILLRLPAKSLGRFRSVSKDFLSLISDPKFIKTHFKTLNQNHIIFSNWCSLYSHPFHHHEDEALLTPTLIEFDLAMDFDSYFYCGSCNGLVLVFLRWRNGNYRLVLYNPITKEFLELPLLEIKTMTGFGYDSVTDDYKIVTIAYYGRSRSKVVHVYSLRTNTWRPLIDYAYDNSYDYGINGYSGVFVNGFVHWIAKKKSTGLHVIVAFSFADEIFSEVTSPKLRGYVNIVSDQDCRLFVFDGKLAIFSEGVVWLMNEYGIKESWTKILLCGIDEIQMEKPVVSDDNGKVLVADKDRMLVYDVEKRSFGKTVLVWNSNYIKVTGTFVESLVSPKVIIEA